jgi:hypothetical protein
MRAKRLRGGGAAQTRARVRLGGTGGGGDRWPPPVGDHKRGGAGHGPTLGRCWAGLWLAAELEDNDQT